MCVVHKLSYPPIDTQPLCADSSSYDMTETSAPSVVTNYLPGMLYDSICSITSGVYHTYVLIVPGTAHKANVKILGYLALSSNAKVFGYLALCFWRS